MHFITDFADQAVVLPLAVGIGLTLLLSGWRRGAIAWGVVVVATLASVGVAKMVVADCGGLLPIPPGLHSPSGHTASAAIVYGGLVALLCPRLGRGIGVPLLAGGFALVIGFTRLALHIHTPFDVLAGAAIGIAGAVLLARAAGERPPGLRIGRAAAVAFAVLLVFHGEHLHAESRLHHLAHLIWPINQCRADLPVR